MWTSGMLLPSACRQAMGINYCAEKSKYLFRSGMSYSIRPLKIKIIQMKITTFLATSIFFR